MADGQNAQVLRACAAVLAALALTACSVPGFGGPPAPVLKIGVDLPLGGAEGRVATPALDGVRFYVQQHPTLDGFAIELVAKDDSLGGSPEAPLGAANVQALASDPAVMAVIGPFDSSVARDEIPVANQASLAMVSPATSSPCLTKPDYVPAPLRPSHVAVSCKDAGLPAPADLRPSGVNNYFRLAATDDLQGPAAADYAIRSLHLLRVATISDHEAYGQALAGSFAARFQALGGSIVGRLDLDPSATLDATAYLGRMKADGYAWWRARIRANLRQVDLVRLDHFRGFEAAWHIPADAPTAHASARPTAAMPLTAPRYGNSGTHAAARLPQSFTGRVPRASGPKGTPEPGPELMQC